MSKTYHVDNVTVDELLDWISHGRIGLPAMQRPFVWNSTKVRDLLTPYTMAIQSDIL